MSSTLYLLLLLLLFPLFQDNSSSLLHYTVIQYIKKFEGGDAGTEKAKYVLPDPGDLHQASNVFFEELEKELRKIKEDFNGKLNLQIKQAIRRKKYPIFAY